MLLQNGNETELTITQKVQTNGITNKNVEILIKHLISETNLWIKIEKLGSNIFQAYNWIIFTSIS